MRAAAIFAVAACSASPPTPTIRAGVERDGLATVRGRVLFEGRPVQTFAVIGSQRSFDRRLTCFCGGIPFRTHDGRFVLPNLPPETWGFTIVGPGFRSIDVADRELRADTTLDLGDLVPEPGTTLRGRVRDPVGAPVAGVRVALTNVPFIDADELTARACGNYATTSDGRGYFEIRGIDADLLKHASVAVADRAVVSEETPIDDSVIRTS